MKGSKLSGGQKQRIAIARVVIRNPAIYMFDEATSALDAEGERTVQKAIESISSIQATTLSIAHRISTIVNSDIIFFIKGGIVAESGTYGQLIDLKSHFFEMNFD